MKKLLVILSVLVLAACSKTTTAPTATSNTFTPSFVVDYNKCGTDPVISGNSVTFGEGSTCEAGRLVSQHGYVNISQITATVDLSKLSQNYVNASFYMVSNPVQPNVQPKGTNYCDAGGNGTQWNCQEIDFLETNGNKITQSTLHLGTGGSSAPQRFEYSFADTANNSCFNYSSMTSSPTATNGLHSMVGIIDMSKPFDMVTNFTYGTTPTMSVTYSQNGKSVVVYDSSVGTGAEGSGTVDMTSLVTSMKNGYWLNLAFWQGYSPTGPGSAPWWNNTCSWGSLCNSTGSYWSISNIQVIADSIIQ
jgi:hypothetical protein